MASTEKETSGSKVKERAVFLTKIFLRGLGGDFVGAFEQLEDAFNAHRNPDATPEERAWVLWRETAVLALEEFFRGDDLLSGLTEKELVKAVKKFLKETAPEKASVTLELKDLIDPTGTALYRTMRERFPDFLKEVDPDRPKKRKKADLEKLDRCIERGVERAWANGHAFFDVLAASRTGPVAEGQRRRLQWAKHNDWIRQRFERKPIWGQEETGITLADLYVRLRAFRKFEIEPEKGAGRHRAYGEPMEYRAELLDSHDAVWEWLREDNAKDSLRLISGGPGSGKSTFAKALAVEVCDDPEWRVLFVEVQGFGAITDLEVRIGRALSQRLDDGFDENPLGWLPFGDGKKLLIILDGLDELASPGEEDRDIMQKFTIGVNSLLQNKNAGKLRVKALIVGRAVAVSDALEKLTLPIHCMWTVSKMTPIGHDDARVSKKNFKAAPALSKSDQREIYWKNWIRAKGLTDDGTCPLQNEGFGELTFEPILNYLLILSGYTDAREDPSEVIDNVNLVYDKILGRLLPREWGTVGHPASYGLGEDDFFFLLECLGLAAWSNGGRVGDSDEFVRIRSHCAKREQAERYKDLRSADLENVATTFYTRREGGFEFVHKSFGEYLVARGLLRYVCGQLRFMEEHSPDAALEGWLTLCGRAEPTKDIINFIRNEARLMRDETLSELKPMLERLLTAAIHEGFPGRNPANGTWRDVERAQVRSEISLLASLNAIFRARRDVLEGFDKINIDWRTQREAARNFLNRLYFGADETAGGAVSQHLLEGIEFSIEAENWKSGAFLNSVFLPDDNLTGANFEKCNLHNACLSESLLTNAQLSGCLLNYADLMFADLRGADMSDAELDGAEFKYAMIDGTRLPHDWRKTVRNADLTEGTPILVNDDDDA